MYWRYVDCSCLGRATTDENDQVIAENHAHDHKAIPKRLPVRIMMIKLRTLYSAAITIAISSHFSVASQLAAA